ncbi:MAG: hypothetical protein IJ157_01475, partial [Clostridia bacterium]|nr:hypothetical protein [Clostridia bacterium]
MTLSNNFRQFSFWVVAKRPSEAMKKASADRLEQAPSVVPCLFRDCCAILGPLRVPTSDWEVLSKFKYVIRTGNDGGLPTSMTRQRHSDHTEMPR